MATTSASAAASPCLIAFLCCYSLQRQGLAAWFQSSLHSAIRHAPLQLGVQFFDSSAQKRLQLNVFGVYIHSCANRLLGFSSSFFYFCHFLSFRRADRLIQGLQQPGDTITLHLPLFGLYAPLSRRSPSTNFLAAFSQRREEPAHSGGYPAVGRRSLSADHCVVSSFQTFGIQGFLRLKAAICQKPKPTLQRPSTP